MSPIGGVRSGLMRKRAVEGPTLPQTGLIHHFNASDLSLSDGNEVTTWADLAGTADLSAVGSPTYNASNSNLNGKPTVIYDGVDDGHRTGGSAVDSSPPYHLFYVIDSGANSNDFVFSNESLGMQHRQAQSGSDDKWWHGSWVAGGTDLSSQASLIAFLHTTSETTIRRNGGQIGSESNTHNPGGDGTRFIMGKRYNDGGQEWDGEVAELLWYNEEKTGQELTDVENYLATKYGFTI